MGFLSTILSGITREAKITKLKNEFKQAFPGEETKGTLEAYCGLGIAVAQSINDGAEDRRLNYINLIDEGLLLENEQHRPFVTQAYEIGVQSTLKK